MIKPTFVLLTGGPGAGKSSVIKALEQKNHHVVTEAARKIIRQQKAIGSDATQTGDKLAFCNLLLKHCLNDYLDNDSIDKWTFFDRGLPDLLAYKTIAQGKGWHDMLVKVNQAIKQYRYNEKVFIFPPWQQIYHTDSERAHTFEQAKSSCHALRNAYKEAGYQLIEVPKCSINERVDFIIQTINTNR